MPHRRRPRSVAEPPAGPPDNKLVWSILVTLFCCLPFGIVAIIKSAEVNSKWSAGDVAGANQAAADAGKWIKWSVIVSIVAAVIGIVFWILSSSSAAERLLQRDN